MPTGARIGVWETSRHLLHDHKLRVGVLGVRKTSTNASSQFFLEGPTPHSIDSHLALLKPLSITHARACQDSGARARGGQVRWSPTSCRRPTMPCTRSTKMKTSCTGSSGRSRSFSQKKSGQLISRYASVCVCACARARVSFPMCTAGRRAP